MAQTLYSHTLRILTCAGCGAPIDASVEGGSFVCAYCSAPNQLHRRDESADLARARQEATVSESERYARLRAQDRQPEPLPDAIAAMLVEGHLPTERVAQAEAEWRAARAQLAVAPSFPVAERLFHLTVLLVPHLDERRQRAMLETAVELLPDEGHRHILRCTLARLAARASDLIAAQAWLSPCNPRPLDLAMDTAYRLAAATVAHVENDPRKVAELLGMRPGDVPIADRDELPCWLLRLDALERLGQLEDAVRELEAWIRRYGAPALEQVLARQRPLRLCEQAFSEAQRRFFDSERRARQQHHGALLEGLRGQLAEAERPWFGLKKIFGFVLLTALVTIPVGGLWSCILFGAADADPFFGAHAGIVCPRVCVGCRGPYRTASWQTTTNNSSSSHSSTYCADPEGRIQSMEQGAFWLAAVNGEPWMERYEVPGGSFLVAVTTMVVFTPLGMLVALLAMVSGYRARRRRRADLAEKVWRAEQELARS